MTSIVLATSLVEDFDLYPRMAVNLAHVNHLAEVIESGTKLPPIIACRKSKRIVDGFHRRRAHIRAMGSDDVEVEVEFIDYSNEAELLLDAIRRNSAHGRGLGTADRMRALIMAERVGLDDGRIAKALNVKVEKLAETRKMFVVRIEGTRQKAVLKMPIRHLSGGSVTKAQAEAIPKLGGNSQEFLIQQLIILIETGMFDAANEQVMAKAGRLHELLGNVI